MGKREQNKQANRAAILNAALDVFCDIGYDACRLHDVIEASGLSVGTFYNYFGDKPSLIAPVVDDILEQVRVEVHQARTRADTPEDFIQNAFSAFLLVMLRDERNLRLMQKNTSIFRQRLYDGDKLVGIFADLEADMQAAIEANLFPPFPVRMMTSAMIGATMEVVANARGEDQQVLENYLSQLFLGGIERLARQTQQSPP